MFGDAKAAQRPSWATERAVGLQLREMGVAPNLPELTPDAQKARDVICGLCFVRFDPRWRDLMRSSLMAMAAFSGSTEMRATFTMPGRQFFSAAGWTEFGKRLLPFVDAIPGNPEQFPFALSQPEYTHYAVELFGSEMAYVDASYRPRSFYLDLAEIALIAAGGFIASAFAASMLPEMVALGAVGAKVVPGMANAIAGGVGGSMLSATMGPDIAGDAKKARLLPIYRCENLRRRAVG